MQYKIQKETQQFTSWRQIKANKSNLEVGDEVADAFVSGEEVTFVVVGKIGNNVIFATKDILRTLAQMNQRNTNKGGWEKSDMRWHLNNEVIHLLSPELREVIAVNPVTDDKLWLFSEREVFEKANYSDDTQKQFEYFKDQENRIKSGWWWMRSPYSSNTTNFVYVNAYGAVSISSASYSSGVCVGFCI
jgi:hypothetical protein